MGKKVTALVTLMSVFFVWFIPQARAVSENILNRQTAVELVVKNSTQLWNAKEEERFAKEEYEEQAARAQSIDIEKFSFENPFTGEEEYYYYTSAEQMQLRMAKEFVPESLKFSHEVKEKTVKFTENALSNAADELFLGLYSTYHSVKLAEKGLELARKNLQRQQELFDKGIITELELEEAVLDLKEAENSVKKAKRDFENMHRTFNRLAGLPLDFRYDLIGTPRTDAEDIRITEDEAVKSALENRMEIWSTKRQIELVELRMEIYRHKNVYKFDYYTIKDYAEAQDELENLKLTLVQQEYDIEKEIRQAYKDLKKSYNNLKLAELNLERQKNQLETLKKQYEKGLIPASAVEQTELAISNLEFAVNMSLISYLNKQDRFYRAISVGPGVTE
ncbi:hypothetical protein Cst_c23880 [Thermoclostridium stercorarium subsp. stercorarium DSM 8532]|uniref:CzcB-like alpha-helical hairpin domain-containing protein n=3 Tax=Thermoclostridium stercorarium TaxID=1510 RepID=L7VUT6_THES1|nr:TolC family protein [Thermoclostridium stercorarium]AGC69348.1 hypothetical protein Cst_c23880 [Thermoclostridium stercorarium subsp. stercorarium DSM 8532]AGI40310.1 outer membrane protein [Thermoclostridium stercorarium subsp. stercorarium DSM 8532]ANW99608.1 hypothetical protein CSTERTH_11470 [Thermoclostridium stercorarium subsp. thermolacticum DSM 2910]